MANDEDEEFRLTVANISKKHQMSIFKDSEVDSPGKIWHKSSCKILIDGHAGRTESPLEEDHKYDFWPPLQSLFCEYVLSSQLLDSISIMDFRWIRSGMLHPIEWCRPHQNQYKGQFQCASTAKRICSLIISTEGPLLVVTAIHHKSSTTTPQTLSYIILMPTPLGLMILQDFMEISNQLSPTSAVTSDHSWCLRLSKTRLIREAIKMNLATTDFLLGCE